MIFTSICLLASAILVLAFVIHRKDFKIATPTDITAALVGLTTAVNALVVAHSAPPLITQAQLDTIFGEITALTNTISAALPPPAA